MKIGPVGRVQGDTWDHKGQSQVVQIFLTFGPRYLNSLSFQYFKDDGGLVTSDIIGRQSRDTFQTIVLDYPSEYIVEVNGVYSSYIEELTIVTNKQHYVCKTFQGHDRYNNNNSGYRPPNSGFRPIRPPLPNCHNQYYGRRPPNFGCRPPLPNRHNQYEGGFKSEDKGKWFKLDIGRLAQFGGFYGTHDSNGVRSIGVYVDPITSLVAHRTAPIDNTAYEDESDV